MDRNHDISGRMQSPAAKEARATIAEAVSAAVQGKFDDMAKRFTDSDRSRLGDQFKDNSTLRDRFTQFNNDWKAKYNQDFDSSNIEKALSDASIQIYQGDYTDRARTASERIRPDNTRSDTGGTNINKPGEGNAENRTASENNSGAFSRDNQTRGNTGSAVGGANNPGANNTGAGVTGSGTAGATGTGNAGATGTGTAGTAGATGTGSVGATGTGMGTDRTTETREHAMAGGNANDKDVATFYFGNSHNLAPSAVALRKESGIGNTWKIDLPDSINGQQLSDSLTQHVMMVLDQKGSWPADVNDAYRMVTHHVLMGLADTGAGGMNRTGTGTDRTGTDRSGQPGTPGSPSNPGDTNPR